MIDTGLYVVETLQANQILTIGYRVYPVLCLWGGGKGEKLFFLMWNVCLKRLQQVKLIDLACHRYNFELMVVLIGVFVA